MKIIDFRTNKTKVCHSRPGDCVRVFDNTTGADLGLFIICSAGKLEAQLSSSGLYKADKPIFMVSLSTGEALMLPHLSSKTIEIMRDVSVIINDTPDRTSGQ